MSLLYNIGLWIFDVTLIGVSLFNDKAKKLVVGRKETWLRIQEFAREGHTNIFWFHAASLGEFEQGRPIMEGLKASDPSVKIVLTFFSPSGYEVRKNYTEADLIIYLPGDSRVKAKRFISLVNPNVAIFIKYEFWYHYLNECANSAVITLSVSSNFRNEQPFFKWYGTLHRKMLNCFSHFFVQDENSFELLSNLGLKNLSISGDTRFDRVKEIARNAKRLPEIEEFKNNQLMIVLGSTWESDIKVILPELKLIEEPIKIVIAPHNISENEINSLAKEIDEPVFKYSQIETLEPKDYKYLIIDNIGLLSSLYGYGDFAYVGGAFRGALHNILEPAAHGIPVFYGDDPSNIKFREARELAECGAGLPFKTASEFSVMLNNLIENQEKRKELGEQASKFVSSNSGATQMVLDYLKKAI